MKPQRLAIIGAGTAGLASTALLARQGHHITLIERAPALAPVGAGLLLQPAALPVLDRLGAREPLHVLGAQVDRLIGDTTGGRTVMDVSYATLDPALHGLGVHRASLCHVLDQAAQQTAHQRWMATEVTAIEPQGEGVVLRLLRGAQADNARFDAVLVANGSASGLRPPALVRYDRPYPWGALWAMLPATPACPTDTLRQRYQGSHTMIGLLPTGCTPDAPGQSLQSFFWSLPVTAIAQWQRGEVDFAHWQEQLTQLWPEAADALAAITDPSQLMPATYRDVILKRFAVGRVGLLGDAAHAMSPQLGQGATLALCDAAALADAVATQADWPAVWQAYHQRRVRPIRFYQAMSRLLTPVFQSRIPGAGFGRDLGFPLMNQVPWLRRAMAETVAGLRTGFIR